MQDYTYNIRTIGCNNCNARLIKHKLNPPIEHIFFDKILASDTIFLKIFKKSKKIYDIS